MKFPAPMRVRAAAALLALCAASLAGGCAHADNGSEWLEVNDLPYVWEFDAAQDMQLPELPTGCEATALSTLMRMHGVAVTKTEVADAMPRSDGEDFVRAFWGDPYSERGWACMVPCSASTANSLLPKGLRAVGVRGREFADLDAPCVIWVTIGMAEAVLSGYAQEGFELAYNPHCVVLLGVEEDTAHVVDPLEGEVSYPADDVRAAYESMGRQSLTIEAT